MKSVTIREIAKRLGVSKTTVSCALNHRGGVTAETAQAIRQAAEEMGYCFPKKDETPFCGIVLPDKPRYFWGTARQTLCRIFEQNQIPYHASVYPLIAADQSSFLGALNDVMKKNPSVLVVTAPYHPDAKKELQRIAERVPVFLLSEDVDDPRFFYFGSHASQDGAALAKAFRQRYPQKHRILIWDTVQNQLRTDNFLSAAPDLQVVYRSTLPGWHPSRSATLARHILSEVKEPFDCVYCGSGNLPTVCLALDKLKLDPNIICIGYENPPGNQPFWKTGRIGMVLCQDIVAQSELCAKAVLAFYQNHNLPNQKYNYVDSQIL